MRTIGAPRFPTGPSTRWARLAGLLLVALALTGCTVMPPVAADDAPPVLEPSTTPIIAVAPTTARPGTTIYVSGAGWTADDAVFVNLATGDGDGRQEVTVAATVVASDGRFSASFVFPYDDPWRDLTEVELLTYSVDSDARAMVILGVLPETPQPAAQASPSPSATATAAATATATATPIPASGGDILPDIATVESTGLNMRTGPGGAYAIVTELRRGDQLYVLGQSADSYWIFGQTVDEGILGWVARRFTDYRGTGVPVVTPNPPSRPVRPVRPATATPSAGRPSISGDWRAEYFNNMSLTGKPALLRTDASLDFDWGYGAPGPGVQRDYFSARWVQTAYLPAGAYRFYADVDDGVRIFVDDRLVMDQWHAASGYVHTADTSLGTGQHTIRVEYFEIAQIAKIRVWWQRIGDVPAETLYPDWRGDYYANRFLSGTPRIVRNDPAIDFNWGTGSPDPRLPSDEFSVRWTRTVYFDSHKYRFRARMDDGMRVYLDGALIIDEWRDGSARDKSADRDLSAGYHTLVVEFYEHTGMAEAHLYWERVDDTPPTPSSFPDWKGEYWSNRKLDGGPKVTRNDRAIDFNWGTGSPDSRIPSDNFSARWTRRVTFDPGWYRFYARTDDGVRVWVDGDRIIDEWRDSSGSDLYEAERYLDGRKRLKVEYYERSGGAMIDFFWERVDGPTSTPTLTPTGTATGQTPTLTPTATHTPTPDATRAPNVRVRPDAGQAGTAVTVSGGGFPAGTRVDAYLGSPVRSAASAADGANRYASATTDEDGAFSMDFSMPATWPDGSDIAAGDLIVLVATEDFDVSATALFTYRVPRPTAALDPYAEVSPRSGSGGTSVTVRGGGFPAGARLAIHVGSVARGVTAAAEPVTYASTTADSDGNFNATFTMPVTWPDGAFIDDGKLVIVAATADFSVQASDTFDYFTSAPNPALTIRPRSGGAETVVTVNGDGYPANTTVDILLATLDGSVGDGAPVRFATTETDRNGKFSSVVTIPAVWPDGTPNISPEIAVVATVRNRDIQASAVFRYDVPAVPEPIPTAVPPTVTPVATPTATPNPGIGVSPGSGSDGTDVIVSGKGFPPSRTVNIHLGPLDGDVGGGAGYERYANAATNRNGDFSVGFTMPGSWPDGSQIPSGKILVIAATDDFAVSASTTFDYAGVAAAVEVPPTATPEPAPPTATPLPPTDTPEPAPPTATPLPPTDTPEPAPPTATPLPPTNTPEPEPPTATPLPPTDTPEPEPDLGSAGGGSEVEPVPVTDAETEVEDRSDGALETAPDSSE